jgi:histidinol-phosphate aminotransferase
VTDTTGKKQVSPCVKRWVSPEILSLHPYHVAPADGMVKLDAMENPYTVPQSLRDEWQDAVGKVALNRYPDPDCSELKTAIREKYKVPQQCEIVLGNGSDELIQLIAILVGGEGRTFVTPEPGFSMYRQICTATGTGFSGVALKPDFSLDRKEMEDAITQQNPACIFIAYPNNPTGNCFDESVLERVLELATGLVVIDEAYFAFCGKSWMDRIPDYPNLLVLRTLSKSGLAGIRLGMLFGAPQWAGELEKLRLPYNINSLSQASARFYLERHEVLEQQAEMVVNSREGLFRELNEMPQIQAYPSETNFLLVRFTAGANHVYEQLKSRGVLVRNLHIADSLLENCLRITVGTDQENAKLVDALRDISVR